MTRTRREKKTNEQLKELRLWPEKVIGGKSVQMLKRYLATLREEDAHGNRQLFLDDVFVAYLLAFFNPTIRSLRAIEDFSQTRQGQRHLSVTKICRSTASDFNRMADPERLQPLMLVLHQHLAQQQTGRGQPQDDLGKLLRRTIAVDGTFLSAAADVAWAVGCNNQRNARTHRARLDAYVGVESWLPELIVVPEPGQSESESAAAHVQAGKLHIYDRGYSGYCVINAHYEERKGELAERAQFLIRYKRAGGNSPELKEAEERELTDADREAGVVSDRVGRFRSSNECRHKVLDVPLREVIVEYQEGGETKTLRLITNLLDPPAAVIAQLYRYRWQVELFFRWLKCFGNFSHLISHAKEGVLLNFYVAVIAMMLMYLHTGYRPSKYMFNLMSLVASGGATWEEIEPILRERERQCEVARQGAARRRAKKQAEAQ